MQKLFMLLIGANPKNRFIEQHDVFFGIGISIKELIPHILESWPEADGKIHIDAWQAITYIDGYDVQVVERKNALTNKNIIDKQLYFLNLGGYKPNEFEEFHYKLIAVANNKMEAIGKAKKTAFFKHTGFKGAVAHIDDKYGIDVDDIFLIEDILPSCFKNKYYIQLNENSSGIEEDKNIGYIKLDKLNSVQE